MKCLQNHNKTTLPHCSSAEKLQDSPPKNIQQQPRIDDMSHMSLRMDFEVRRLDLGTTSFPKFWALYLERWTSLTFPVHPRNLFRLQK